MTALLFAVLAQFVVPPAPATGPNAALPASQYQTTAALNLWVATTGSDGNTCTSAGSPCLTLQGAENKIPKLVRHPVVVTVAAGTYAGVAIYGHTFDPAVPANGAYIQWTGSLATASVATGTATGTATAGSAGSGSTFGTLTDGANTLTANDVRLKLLTLTGGTGSGQVKAICSNTATVITICGAFSPAPDATTTYAIQVPAATITSSASISAYPGVASTTGGGIYAYNNVRLRNSATVGSLFFNNIGSTVGAQFQNSSLQIINCVFSTASAGGSALNIGNGSSFNLSGSSFAATTGFALNAISAGTAGFGSTWSGSIFLVTTGNAAALTLTGSQSSFSEYVATGAATNVVALGGDLGGGSATNVFIGTSRVTCGNSASIGVGLVSNSNLLTPYNNATLGTVAISGCGTGVNVPYPSAINIRSTATLTGASTGTAVSVSKGGRVHYDGSGPTVSLFTNETSIDGTARTFATINAATPPAFMDANYGSFIGR